MGFLKSWPLALRRGLKVVDDTPRSGPTVACPVSYNGREREASSAEHPPQHHQAVSSEELPSSSPSLKREDTAQGYFRRVL